MKKRLDDLLAEFEKTRAWGNIEIEFQNGVAVRIRKSTTEKLKAQENDRAEFSKRSY